MDDSDKGQYGTGVPNGVLNMLHNDEDKPSSSSSEQGASESSVASSSSTSSSADSANETSSNSASVASRSSNTSESASASRSASVASEAEQEASASAKNERLRSKRDKDFANETESKYDVASQAQMELQKAKDDLGSYIKSVVENSDNSKSAMRRLGMLGRAQTDIVRSIRLFEAEYNHTILRLRKQINDVNQIQQTYQEANPQKSLDILKDWARTGMPSRIQHSYQKLAWVVNTPEFKSFLHDNEGENLDDTAVPKSAQARYDSEVSEERSIAQSESSSSAKKE